MHWWAIALGGALGATARAGLAMWLLPVLGPKFPISTMLANIIGSFVIGIVYVLILEKAIMPAEYRPFIMVGFLGAFTTFSTFALDALLIWEGGQPAMAAVYMLLTLMGCMLAVTAAVLLARFVF